MGRTKDASQRFRERVRIMLCVGRRPGVTTREVAKALSLGSGRTADHRARERLHELEDVGVLCRARNSSRQDEWFLRIGQE